MNIALWIAAGLLAAAFVAAGTMKVTQPKKKLASAGMGWVDDFSDGGVKAIGALEVLGALGLILPAVTGLATILVPAAATGLALLMVGAAIKHLRRGEAPMIAINAVLLLIALFVAWGRFGAYAF